MSSWPPGARLARPQVTRCRGPLSPGRAAPKAAEAVPGSIQNSRPGRAAPKAAEAAPESAYQGLEAWAPARAARHGTAWHGVLPPGRTQAQVQPLGLHPPVGPQRRHQRGQLRPGAGPPAAAAAAAAAPQVRAQQAQHAQGLLQHWAAAWREGWKEGRKKGMREGAREGGSPPTRGREAGRPEGGPDPRRWASRGEPAQESRSPVACPYSGPTLP